ncbi:MAG: hypothetical protein ACJAXI_001945 [Crocinitomicaceae bacterium]|jgi:hypothetical protein
MHALYPILIIRNEYSKKMIFIRGDKFLGDSLYRLQKHAIGSIRNGQSIPEDKTKDDLRREFTNEF